MNVPKDGKPDWLRRCKDALVSLVKACSTAYRGSFAATSLMLATSSKAGSVHELDPLLSEPEWTTLINSLILVESRGRDDAWNRAEDARGCLQIRHLVVDDYNLHNPDDEITHNEVFKRDVAMRVCRWYLEYWGRHSHLSGRDPLQLRYQVLSRIWNGGPAGFRKGATLKYWHRVSNVLPLFTK